MLFYNHSPFAKDQRKYDIHILVKSSVFETPFVFKNLVQKDALQMIQKKFVKSQLDNAAFDFDELF